MLSQLKKYQLFWLVAAKIYKVYPIKNLKKSPKAIFVDITNSCNLRCPVCPTHLYMKRARGFMDFNLYKLIIDDFKNKSSKPDIFMYFAGEPLLNPDVDKMVAYAVANRHQAHISTNVTMLTKDLSIKLINAGLTSIHLCLDGFTKKSHEAHRIGSDFEQVKKNIEDFMDARRELNKNKPKACIQTLLTSFSEDETEALTNWARRIGADYINFKSISLGSSTTEEQKNKYAYLLPTKKEWLRKTTNIYKTLCSWPRDNAVVYWNGDLGLCCIDYDGEIKLPNIKEKGFLNAFMSEDAVRIRKMGMLKKMNLCERCSMGNADFIGVTYNFK